MKEGKQKKNIQSIPRQDQSSKHINDAQIPDNRPEAVVQKKLKSIADNGIVQRQFRLDGQDDQGAAFYRNDNIQLNQLKLQIRSSPDTCLYKFAADDFSASEGDAAAKAKVTIPNSAGNKGDAVDNLNSTVHELVHAQAILAGSYNVVPQIFHIVYDHGVLKSRELIPLEEALTVGFENTGTLGHEFRSTDTYKLLQYFTTQDWEKLVPGKKSELMRARFERIYPRVGTRADHRVENIVENTVHLPGKKRDTYANVDLKGPMLDEAWDQPAKHARSRFEQQPGLEKGRKKLLEDTYKADQTSLQLAINYRTSTGNPSTLPANKLGDLNNYISNLQNVTNWARLVLLDNGKDLVEVDYVMKRSEQIKTIFEASPVAKDFKAHNGDNMGGLFD